MIALHAYQLLEDAWHDGVAAWCRAASSFVLRGGRAWMVTASEGQGNWMRARMLREGESLFGVQFLHARSLRRELCLRTDHPAPALDGEGLEFLLRLYAMRNADGGFEWSSVARHPGACLAALGDLANALWMDNPDDAEEVLPRALMRWLPELRGTGAWNPEIDRELLARAATVSPGQPPLSVCVFGWDASDWPGFDLLRAALRTADDASVYTPLPRGTSETVQQSWLEALEETAGGERHDCKSSGFVSSQADLVGKLEGADLGPTAAPGGLTEPELLVGADHGDLAVLVRDFTVRWLAARPRREEENGRAAAASRLVILCPGRNASSVGVVRALTGAGLAVEDELGELPEPSLAVQIQRAILDYHQDNAGLGSLLALIELLNEYDAVWERRREDALRAHFPLDAVAVRRAFHGAFAEAQHHSVRVLGETTSFLRTEAAHPLRDLITHLGEWPETLEWTDALRRWELTLDGFGLNSETLAGFWSRLNDLPVTGHVPSQIFFQYLGRVLAYGVPARRAEGAANRFARVVVTTLEGAIGQTWDGVVFLDSTEGTWPIQPPENPFLDDAARQRLNERRAAAGPTPANLGRHHLLTSADHAQLEHFRFLEILENNSGPLVFAGVLRDPTDSTKELYPNEWVLRCLVESGTIAATGESLQDRWRHAVCRTARSQPPLARREAMHLGEVFSGRRRPENPFDEYFLNFEALRRGDELPFDGRWTARDLENVWTRPATFALGEVFGVETWRDGARELARGEGWMVGRLVHRWVHAALRGSDEPRRLTELEWQRALTTGLAQARAETENRLRAAGGASNPLEGLSLWWQGVLSKAQWATRRCLETLADTVRGTGLHWLCLDKNLRADLAMPERRLRVSARCDVLLADQPGLAGAACQLIDIRTGATPTVSKTEEGRTIRDAALLFLAREAGAAVDASSASVIHPDAALMVVMNADAIPGMQPVFERLAVLQGSLCFGQRGGIVNSGPGRRDAENLPLATTPVDPAILEMKNHRSLR